MVTSHVPLAGMAAIRVFCSVKEQFVDRIVGVRPEAVVALKTDGVRDTVEPAFGERVMESDLRSALTDEKTVGNTRIYAGLALSRPAPNMYTAHVLVPGPLAALQSTDVGAVTPDCGFGSVP
jgi:hypothetical protein